MNQKKYNNKVEWIREIESYNWIGFPTHMCTMALCGRKNVDRQTNKQTLQNIGKLV